MNRVYVFALTGHATSPFTVDEHRIEFMDLGDLHAAVERHVTSPSVSEAALRSQHEIVMRIFERVDGVLPVRFGAWIDERELNEVVRIRKAAIQAALNLVRGRVQMTVRFRAAPAPLLEDSPNLAAVGGSGTAYLQARRNAERMLPAEAQAITSAVRDLVVAERASPSSRRSQPTLYHLIARDSVAQYRAATAALRSPALSISGPWAPFAFAPDLWE
jgi:hypothetical protein